MYSQVKPNAGTHMVYHRIIKFEFEFQSPTSSGARIVRNEERRASDAIGVSKDTSPPSLTTVYTMDVCFLAAPVAFEWEIFGNFSDDGTMKNSFCCFRCRQAAYSTHENNKTETFSFVSRAHDSPPS
jgi:hypothetical protein